MDAQRRHHLPFTSVTNQGFDDWIASLAHNRLDSNNGPT